MPVGELWKKKTRLLRLAGSLLAIAVTKAKVAKAAFLFVERHPQ